MNAPTTSRIPITDAMVRWLASGERGLSSETIFEHITGVGFGESRRIWGRVASHPLDPDDLRRCVLLLDQCPELAERLGEMRTCSPVWARLVDAWDELVGLLRTEVRPSGRGSAPRCYARMREVIGDG